MAVGQAYAGSFEGDKSVLGCGGAVSWAPNPKSFLFFTLWFRSRKDQGVNFRMDSGQFTYSLLASGS